MKAEIHPQQQKRLSALRQYDILDTPREHEFDEIVNLAGAVCEAPISVVTFVDAERQWFKAENGLGVRETPLDKSICSHVILEKEFTEIPDTLADPRTADNPLCLGDPHLRFYAGAPLQTKDGLPLGTLCVLDHQPRQLSDLQRRTLKILAGQVMRELELRKALRNQEILRREMDHRVKNSLQSVASLIRIYRSFAPDAASSEAFDTVQRRIDGISLLHQELQQASNTEIVPLDHYLTNIIGYLQQSAPETVTIMPGLSPVSATSSQASNIAIIVSEFVANSLKHAFPGDADGTISIRLEQTDGGTIVLTCSDNGIGNTVAPAAETKLEGLGLKLVDAAAEQLGATLERHSDESGYHMKLTV